MFDIFYFLIRYNKPILLLICIVFACKFSASNKPVKYVKRFMGQKIRYDKITNRKHRKIATGITCLWAIIVVVLIGWQNWIDVNGRETALIGVIQFNLFNLFLAMTFIAWMVYLDGLSYLKRLRKNGYEVPEDKRKYVHLERLPKVDDHVQNQNAINKESVVLAVMCWLTTLVIIIAAVRFWNEHSAVPDIVMCCMVVIAVMVVCWLVSGICLWRQRLYSRYRDDVELDVNRNKRIHIISGMGVAIGIMIACGVVFMYMNLGADYIENAREQARETTDVTCDMRGV